MDNESAAALLEIAWTYQHARKPIPPHLIADLHDVARADTIATRLRSEAGRLLKGAL